MVFLFRFLYIICFMLFIDLIHYVLGRILMKFDKTHKVGVFLYASAFATSKEKLPSLCRLPCDNSCSNWTCPNFYRK